MPPGEFAGVVEHAVRRLYAVLPDKYVAKRELHQAVDGHMSCETEIGSPAVDPPKHGPLKHRFISLFFEHPWLLLLNDPHPGTLRRSDTTASPDHA